MSLTYYHTNILILAKRDDNHCEDHRIFFFGSLLTLFIRILKYSCEDPAGRSEAPCWRLYINREDEIEEVHKVIPDSRRPGTRVVGDTGFPHQRRSARAPVFLHGTPSKAAR
jgi:hypothetical protein